MSRNLLLSIRFILDHPIAGRRKIRSLSRYFVWQIRGLITKKEKIAPFVEKSRIVIEKGLKGATGNYYTGLHDFREMGFLLHFLRKGDYFLDVGANVGSYSILAGAVIGSKVLSIEPVSTTYTKLLKNIRINPNPEQITPMNICLGEKAGIVEFVCDQDTSNRVASALDSDYKTCRVPMKPMNDLKHLGMPDLIKIDVEGFELHVLRGGSELLSERKLKAIIIEINSSNQRYGASNNRVIDLLKMHDFEAYDYDPLIRGLSPAGTNRSGSDYIFVRDPGFVRDRVQSQRPFTIRGLTI